MTLSPPGSSSFMDASRPPVKAGGRVDHRWLVLQLGTASELDLFECFDGGDMLVDENGIGQGPQVLRRLEFRRIGG